MTLVQYDDMIQTVPLDTTNHSFHASILPRALRRRQDLFDTHALDALAKLTPVNTILNPTVGTTRKSIDTMSFA